MLNWIVIWVGLRTSSATTARCRTTVDPVSLGRTDRRTTRRSSPVFWGHPAPGLLHRRRHRARLARRLRISLNRRRSGTRCAPSGSTRRPRGTAGSASRGTTSSPWRSPAASPGSPARSTSSAGSSGSTSPTSRATIGFIGIAVALLGGTPRSASARRAALRRPRDRHVDAEPRPRDLPARARRPSLIIIQGLIVLFVGADIVILLLLRGCGAETQRRRRRRHEALRDRLPTGGAPSPGSACSSASSPRSSPCPRSRSAARSSRSSSGSSR